MDEIKITARIDHHRPDTCAFEVDRPVYAGGAAYFSGPLRAKGSPLPEKLFNLGDVTGVLISGSVVRVTRSTGEDWKSAAGPIAALIREVLRSGAAAVSPEAAARRMPDAEIRYKVEALLVSQINPSGASNGGNVALMGVKDGVVVVRLGGGCQGCGMANATLRQGIEATLREEIPDIVDILDSTDHAAGNNPFYAPSEGP